MDSAHAARSLKPSPFRRVLRLSVRISEKSSRQTKKKTAHMTNGMSKTAFKTGLNRSYAVRTTHPHKNPSVKRHIGQSAQSGRYRLEKNASQSKNRRTERRTARQAKMLSDMPITTARLYMPQNMRLSSINPNTIWSAEFARSLYNTNEKKRIMHYNMREGGENTNE